MGKPFLAVCYQTRLKGIITAVFGVCLCSLLMSVYHLHSANLPTSMDMMHSESVSKLHRRLGADDNDGGLPMNTKKTNESRSREDESFGAKSLKDIDITHHIQTAESGVKKIDNSQMIKNFTGKKVRTDFKRVQSAKWPNRSSLHKKNNTLYHSSNPLYEKPVRTRKNWHGEKYIVYVCHNNMTCAGWGDRQQGIFFAYLMSLVTNRTFKVDFTYPCPLTNLFHTHINNWKIDPSELAGLSSTHLYALNDRTFRQVMKEIDFDKLYPQDVIYITINFDAYYSLRVNPFYKEKFKQKVKGRPRPIMFADMWQENFKMNKRVVNKFTPALNSVNATGKHKLVCAHIRFGRNPTIPRDGDIRNTMETIKPLWKFLKLHSDPKHYRFFVASDWEGFRKKVNKMYKEMIIDIEGDIIHIDKTQGSKYGNATKADMKSYCDALDKVVVDQYILSKCDVLLLTYSGFGKAAAYLRRSNKDLYLMDDGKIQTLVLFSDKNKHQ